MTHSFCKSTAGLFFAFFFVGATTAWAGGGHKAGGQTASFGEPGKASDVTRTVHVIIRDMAYHIEPFQVSPGVTIRFVVDNMDDVEHDFTIAPPAMQAAHRKEMMESMGDMSAMHTDANAIFLKPGESKELIWKFNWVFGVELACNVPGHYEAGMKGMFVEESGVEISAMGD